jgi:hypothetical protein
MRGGEETASLASNEPLKRVSTKPDTVFSFVCKVSLKSLRDMAQPMNPIVRSSRGAFTAHLPLYKVVILPSYLSSTFRLVESTRVLSFRVK